MKARNVNNTTREQQTKDTEAKREPFEDLIKAKRDNSLDDKMKPLATIKIKYAREERREIKYQHRETWMNRESQEHNNRGETPIQEVNRMLDEQSKRTYPNKRKQKRRTTRDYTNTSQLHTMKTGEDTIQITKRRSRSLRGQADKRTPQAIATEDER
jgi:hypothetical protein